jgi:hypothetical protein
VARVTGQLLAAYRLLEGDLLRQPLPLTRPDITQAGITVAVAWYFTQQMLPEIVPATSFPQLVALSERAERLPEFRAAPHRKGSVGAVQTPPAEGPS